VKRSKRAIHEEENDQIEDYIKVNSKNYNYRIVYNSFQEQKKPEITMFLHQKRLDF